MTRTDLTLHPDRLLPSDPHLRSIARHLYAAVRDLPIISPHGHVDPALLVADEPFADPTALLVTPDHYVTRLLHACGVPLDELGVGRGPMDDAGARRAWRHLCANWHAFAATPVRWWFEATFVELFEVTTRPSAASADALYDHLADRLARPDFRPRALYDRFRLQVLATTDDPCDPLDAHAALAADPTWHGRVIPTFRPDRYLEADRVTWTADVARLAEVTGIDTATHDGFLDALADRRRFFKERGATSADHSHTDVRTDPLDRAEADRIHRAALAGYVTEPEAVAYRRHLLGEMARLSCEDGLVMTLHPAVRRNHHTATLDRFGADTGHDIPLGVEFTDALRPLLQRYGTHPGFHLVLFTMDETTWSRELAPLAGFYPSVFVGVPWWFLDAPDTIARFRSAVTEIAGYSRTSGFVDDTRAYCSIPARHDLARRVEAAVLARYVAEHRIDQDEAVEIAVALASTQPERVFKL